MPFQEALKGQSIQELRRHGPFLVFTLTDYELIIHPMLAGRFYTEGKARHLCFELKLSDGGRLAYGDDKKMGKVYLVAGGRTGQIPGYEPMGADILAPGFTFEAFARQIAKKRHQVRVWIMDFGILITIGNAYADEILFTAGIHPKTLCASMKEDDLRRLHTAIVEVMRESIAIVAAAGQSVDVKVRDHMRVRNKKGQPCPVCGTTIRRANVRGVDAFFCPSCQPTNRKQVVDWTAQLRKD